MRAFILAAGLALSLPVAAQAQQLLESYTTFLSSRDHYNSNGVRLTAAWQIIRQDRANYHRFGLRDPGDDWDSFFSSIENRAAAERMLLNGQIDPGTANYIVNNEVSIRVDIYGSGGVGRYISVTAY